MTARRWSPLEKIGDFGGVVAMSSVEPLHTGPGHYMALFHDDGRFIHGGPNKHRDSPAGVSTGTWTVYKTLSTDGGLTWGEPIAHRRQHRRAAPLRARPDSFAGWQADRRPVARE